MSCTPSSLSLTCRTNVSTSPPWAWIFSSISSTAWLAPPCSGPKSALMPAETEANRLACDEPTSRTVEVEQFCSWSACRMQQRSSALDRTGFDLVRLGRARRTSSAGSSRRSPGSCPGTGTAGRPTSCTRTPRWSAAWPAAGSSRSRPARGRTGRASPGRRSTARTPREDSTGIGWASRGKPSKNRLRSSCSSVWRRIWCSNVVELVGASAARRRSAGRTSRGTSTARPAARSGSRGSAGCPRRRRCR